MGERSPRLVVLFSGHMVDVPERAENRFPPQLEDAAAEQIRLELDRLEIGPRDLALCGGAAGGDLLFAEACVDLGVPLEILLPFEQESFLAASVDPSGAGWRQRYHRVIAERGVVVRSAELGSGAGEHSSAFERNNARLLARALAWGGKRLRVVALWNGRSGDGAGGTAAMVEAARQRTNRIHIIDPRSLRAL